ncbi:MspA family porin [Gordonia sp. TBRC 11910]|uniref:MspA family porin n=2 Tax=Gordonia asplenii TaxID=2725283 RepID=A0A848L1Y5_9ACTN|nr:MspA family porin [Gordonia asplenii]
MATSGILATPATATTLTMPAQVRSSTLPNGTTVTIDRTDETVVVTPSMGATPVHRNAVVSGRYRVSLSKPATFLVQAGYIVGCQVSVNGLTSTGTGSGTANNSTGVVTPTVGGGATLSVGPGQAVAYNVTDYERADPFGADQHKKWVQYRNTAHGSLSYKGTSLSVTGCGGYAQARSYANVWVITDTTDQIVSLYGRPFSIG